MLLLFPYRNLRFCFALYSLDTSLPSNANTISIIQMEMFHSRILEAFLESAFQIIFQCIIIDSFRDYSKGNLSVFLFINYKTWPELTLPDRTGHDRMQTDLTGPDQTWLWTSPDLTRPYQALLDQTWLDRTWGDLTGKDLTWPEWTGPDMNGRDRTATWHCCIFCNPANGCVNFEEWSAHKTQLHCIK